MKPPNLPSKLTLCYRKSSCFFGGTNQVWYMFHGHFLWLFTSQLVIDWACAMLDIGTGPSGWRLPMVYPRKNMVKGGNWDKILWMVAKSESPVKTMVHPTIYRVSTIRLVMQDFFHPPYVGMLAVIVFLCCSSMVLPYLWCFIWWGFWGKFVPNLCLDEGANCLDCWSFMFVFGQVIIS